MKKITLLICLTIFTLTAYSQKTQSGYYINSSNQKITGEFMEGDFFNPNALRFKAAGKSFEKLDIDNTIEYGIADDYKFIKRTLLVDNSNLNINQLSQNRDPNWVQETLFLNVIVEGDASLYSSKYNGVQKFFYSVGAKGIEAKQLVYKQYMSRGSSTSYAVKDNNEYKQQLYVDLRCPEDKPIDDFLALSYDIKDLKKIFTGYNSCAKSDHIVYDNKTGNKLKINYTVFAGLHSTSFSTALTDTKDSNITFGVGFELGVVLPSQKFGLFLRAEYESLSAQASRSVRISEWYGDVTRNYNIDANLMNFSIGPRYFFSISEKSKLYIDAGLQMTFPVSNNDYFVGDDYIFPLGSAFSITGGVGYSLNNKFGIELRSDTNRDLSGGSIKFDYTRIGLNLRYTIN